jgi:Flp pilus assembly pilin Flp
MLRRLPTTLYLTALHLGRRASQTVTSRDESGAIPAEVAWIAGIVILALAVIAILSATTTGAANGISLK